MNTTGTPANRIPELDELRQWTLELVMEIRECANQYLSIALEVEDGEVFFASVKETEEARVLMLQHALAVSAKVRGYIGRLPPDEAIEHYQSLLLVEKEIVRAYLI